MEQELYHYGILGMKWGIRRYQNPDGSLTPAGKTHYLSALNGNDRKKTRATDAAHIQRKIDKLDKKRYLSNQKADYRDALVTYRNGLIKDLSDRDIEYGQHMFNMKKNMMIAAFLAGPWGAIGYGALGKAPREVARMEKEDMLARRAQKQNYR